MQFLFLAAVAVVYFAYTCLAFGEFNKNGLPFFFASMTVGFFYSLLWYWSARLVADKSEYFLFVLVWDFVYIGVFYLTPILLFGVKLDKWGIIGMVCMIAGLLVMKMGHR